MTPEAHDALYAKLLAKDAARCNEVMRRNAGIGAHRTERHPPRPDNVTKVTAAIGDTPVSCRQISEQTGVYIDVVRRSVQRLRADGKIELAATIIKERARIPTYRRAKQ